ncbi:FAD-dependent monooxygenase [Streptomyces fumanus]|uniref:Oxidoreductase n=1 Tax=Streptomyces fumanus TaxID=67302 RepID=A0A919A9D2_9ACTN|nr:FAD-dependent monooxygenase [Streptomyces fumanus]GHE92889.1 oxidoreductase [Streptomyces fumanus]
MTETRHPLPRRSALVSGASIAGPAVAYWLHRYGFDVTVVEKAATVRGGGYPIDIRGTAVEAVRRMGLLPRLRKAHVDTRRITFLDPDGDAVAALRPESMAIGADGDLEVRRGDLTEILYDAVRDSVAFEFDDSIAALDDHPDCIEVTFRSGARRTFDVVIGADGLHSHTRRLVLGPEERFHHYLGACFAGFTLPNHLGLVSEGLLWNAPGRSAALYAVGYGQDVFGLLTFRRSDPPFDAFRDPEAQRELLAATFPDDRWEIPRIVAEMHTADDLFFDVVSQIRMPRWSAGRVALVGDACYAPSFLTGQGTSLALAGAYVLAGELATHRDHAEAFAAYERVMRPFVTANQALAGDGDTELFPATEEALRQRNTALRALSALPADRPHAEYSALTLPDYD